MQLKLPTPTGPRARTSDPETSQESARVIEGSVQLGRLQAMVLWLVRTNPGRTALELSEVGGFRDPRVVNRGLSELRDAGMIQEGQPKIQESGRRAQTWWPT